MKRQKWYNSLKFSKAIKLYVVFLLLICILLFIYVTYRKAKPAMHSRHAFLMKNKHVPFDAIKGDKIVHLDLKGAPFKVSYYKALFPLLVRMGATGILMEYEDMFPYNSTLARNISALNCYTNEDIKTINELAAGHNLSVIPLVQTFGHFSFVLKLEKYKDMREIPEFPHVLCPTHEKSLDLVVDMLAQVIEAHPNSKAIHIGADEVFHLGICDRCSTLMSRYKMSKKRLFVEHINGVTSRLHEKYPQLDILMWDDGLRSFTLRDLQDLNKFIYPVVWKYDKDVYEDLGPSLWNLYAAAFPKVWAASAFKGATGSNQYVSDVTHYVQNHRSWLSLIADYKSLLTFQGIILTGWQRYDHFSVLCELLPVSLPSLAMSLRVVNGHKDSPLSPPTEVAKILGCEQPYALIGPAFGSPHCSYEGAEILEGVIKLQQLRLEFDNILGDSRTKGSLSPYNVKFAFSNPENVQSVTEPLKRIKEELDVIDEEISEAMMEIYDKFTVDEWKETYLKPLQSEVKVMLEARNRILSKDVWPRRPLEL